MERGRNLTEKFREEIIINKCIKKISDYCIDESRIEQQIVMPYKFLAFFFCFVFVFVFLCAYLQLQLCSCVHAHVILFMSVVEARISAIMRIGNLNIYIELSYRGNLTTAGGDISQYNSLYYSKRKGGLNSDNISIIRLDSC